jgi:hypothetical protein
MEGKDGPTFFYVLEYQHATADRIWTRVMHSKMMTRLTMVVNIGETTHLINLLGSSSI